MLVEMKNWDNETIGEVELPVEVFERKVNEHLVWEVVRAYLASRRRGTHKAKGRSEVAGTRSKPWKQKHTGRARAGSRQSPLWRKGGVVHGPVPRSYAHKVNTKARRAALRGVLSQRAAEGRVVVLESMEMSEPKTKTFVKQMDTLGFGGEKVLVIEGLENVNLHLASRNRPDVKMLDASSVNAYEVLNHRWILISEQALQALTEVLT